MPKTKISEFSATPGNNTDIDGINISEGCAPSGINDAIRELMAQLKDFQAGTAGDSFNGPIGSTTPAAGTFTNLSASGTFALTGDQVQISEGGTGQTTANAAFNALAPSQSTHAGKYLKTDGTNTSWDALDISTADITGTLPIANGGTGLTALGTGVQTALGQNVTGSGGIVLASSPSLTTPNLGTPSAVTLTNATGLPLSTGVTGTLATTNGGTGLTSFTANGVVYASSTSALTTGSALTFDGSRLGIGPGVSTASSLAVLHVLQAGGSLVRLDRIGAGTSTIQSVETGVAYRDLTLDAANSIFSIGGAEQMRLTSTGLGIGTSSPTAKLDVYDASSPRVAVSGPSTATGYLIFRNTTSGVNRGYVGYEFANDAIPFATAGSERMRLDSSGNLGIGTTSPGGFYGKLTVAGGIRTLDDNSSKLELGRYSAGAPNSYIKLGTNSNSLRFSNAADSADILELTNGGNLGLGVTPSAWDTYRVLEAGFAGSAFISNAGSSQVGIVRNARWASGGWKFTTATSATLQLQQNGEHQFWRSTATPVIGNDPVFSQAMTIDASGNLALGKTSASYRFDLQGAAGENATLAGFFSGGNPTRGLTIGLSAGGGAINDAYVVYNSTVTGGYAGHIWQAAGTERARITSGGYFKASFDGTYNDATGQFHEFVGNVANGYTVRTRCANASPANHYIGEFVFSAASPNNTGALFIECRDSTAARFELRSNGGLANYSANDVNLSDRREKTNFAPATSYLDKICSIPVQTFNYIDQSEDDPGLTLGVVAQDVQAVAPELVMESNWGSKDDPKMRLSIYQTDLQYALMKCIQELKAQNDDLRARVAQLEAK